MSEVQFKVKVYDLFMPKLQHLKLEKVEGSIAWSLIKAGAKTINELKLGNFDFDNVQRIKDYQIPNLQHLSLGGTPEWSDDKHVKGFIITNAAHLVTLNMSSYYERDITLESDWPEFPQLKQLCITIDNMPFLAKCHKTLNSLFVRGYGGYEDPNLLKYTAFPMLRLTDVCLCSNDLTFVKNFLVRNHSNLEFLTIEGYYKGINPLADIKVKLEKVETVIMDSCRALELYTLSEKCKFC
jgi:hypothetical protein